MIRSGKLSAAVTTMIAAIVAVAPRLANACATCGLGENDHAAHAYKASVLFMLASPYASFAVIGGTAYFFYRRAMRGDRDSTPPAAPKH